MGKQKQTSETKSSSRKRNRTQEKCPPAPTLGPSTPERFTPPPPLLDLSAITPLDEKQSLLCVTALFQNASKRQKTGVENELIGVENKLEDFKLDGESTMTTPRS